MRLAAIYIEDHEYLFNEPQTINFGGEYFYEFENIKNDIFVKRTRNEKFIPDFFNLTGVQSKVTNLNAIVGQNGAGKSTLLDIIRSEFANNGTALPDSEALFLFEIEGRKHPIISRNDFGKIYLKIKPEENIELRLGLSKIKIQTLYYSPHFDYKYNPDFSDIDNHDISFDKILENDLEILNSNNVNVNGGLFSATQELLFANSQRQILFLNSELVSKHNIFKGLFDFQNHYNPILHFRKINIEESFWNTPRAFRPILKVIEEKLKTEEDQWAKYRDSGKNKIQVYQYILKRRVLNGILSNLINQMERRNSFLEEGYFEPKLTIDEINSLSSSETFLIFISNSYIQFKDSKRIGLINNTLFQNLVDCIHKVIDKVEKEEDITNETIKVSVEDALMLLKLQREFQSELDIYYTKFYADKSDLTKEFNKKMVGFISYMPFSRRMSSGETSLLNFFSRIYDFLYSNFIELKKRKFSNHYIILLDEADLTFHIKWKKKYVKALLNTLPYFFDELENKPSIEIIFTTHDPITLSDIPNTNVIYIERPDYSSPSKILDFNNPKRPQKTFGANISDLIADSFFIADSLIGDFAFDKIQQTIVWLNNSDNSEHDIYFKNLIKTIDEPIVQRKLAEMYDTKRNGDFQIEVINDQIRKLEELKKRIQ
jgi:hypothetical protein